MPLVATYYEGEDGFLRFPFTDPDTGLPADPSGPVTVVLEDPAGTQTIHAQGVVEFADVIHEGLGSFRLDVHWTPSGEWRAEVRTGTSPKVVRGCSVRVSPSVLHTP